MTPPERDNRLEMEPRCEVVPLSHAAFLRGVRQMMHTPAAGLSAPTPASIVPHPPPPRADATVSPRLVTTSQPAVAVVAVAGAACRAARQLKRVEGEDRSTFSLASSCPVCPTSDDDDDGGYGAHLRNFSAAESSPSFLPDRGLLELDDGFLRGASVSTTMTSFCRSVRDSCGELWSLNQYEVIAPLGQGSCGSVFLVELTSHGDGDEQRKEFAMKSIPRPHHSPARMLVRLENEVTMMQRVNGHPHIVTLHEVIDDLDHDSLFLVMDFMEGGAIAKVDADTGACTPTLDSEEMKLFAAQQASALTFLHTMGMAHGDYKVENVLFTGARGAGLQTKLADFGVAVLQTEAAASPPPSPVHRRTLGTPYIRSPEAFAGAAATAGDDAWAFGVVLHALVTGRIPFAADTLLTLAAAVRVGLPNTPDAKASPLALEWWGPISRLLSPAPNVRLTELRRLAAPAPLTPLDPSPPTSPGISRRRGMVHFTE